MDADACNYTLYRSIQIALVSFVFPILTYLLVSTEDKKRLEIRLFLYYCITALSLNILDQGYIFAVGKNPEAFSAWLDFTGGTMNFTSLLHQLTAVGFIGSFFVLLHHVFVADSRPIKILTFIVAISIIISYLVNEGWINYNGFGHSVVALFTFGVPLAMLLQIVNKSTSLPLSKNSYFWISLGLVIPNVLGLFLFFTGDQIAANDFCLFARFSVVKNGFEVIGQLCFVRAFMLTKYLKYIPGI